MALHYKIKLLYLRARKIFRVMK